MYQLKVVDSFCAAHNLRGYRGKCEELHGHNWKVEVRVEGQKLAKTGMLVDFRKLKKKVEAVLRKFDHQYLNELAPFRRINPTSENIARYIYDKLNSHLTTSGCKLKQVCVWESETSSATYTK